MTTWCFARRLMVSVGLVGPLAAAGGCPLSSVPFFNVVEVQVTNESSFDVAPNIFYDDSASFFSADRPLATGLVAPGETLVFTFDCDALEQIVSDGAEQIAPDADYIAFPSLFLEQGSEFECGDVIEFIFLGDGIDFGVLVAVNGRIIG